MKQKRVKNKVNMRGAGASSSCKMKQKRVRNNVNMRGTSAGIQDGAEAGFHSHSAGEVFIHTVPAKCSHSAGEVCWRIVVGGSARCRKASRDTSVGKASRDMPVGEASRDTSVGEASRHISVYNSE